MCNPNDMSDEDFVAFINANKERMESLMGEDKSVKEYLKNSAKKAQAKIEETNEEIEHTFKRVFDAVFSPEVQKHVVGAGIEMMLGFNAFLKAIPVPDKVQPYIDKVVEARENASAAYCAKNPDCPRKKAAAQSAKAKKIELD